MCPRCDRERVYLKQHSRECVSNKRHDMMMITPPIIYIMSAEIIVRPQYRSLSICPPADLCAPQVSELLLPDKRPWVRYVHTGETYYSYQPPNGHKTRRVSLTVTDCRADLDRPASQPASDSWSKCNCFANVAFTVSLLSNRMATNTTHG